MLRAITLTIVLICGMNAFAQDFGEYVPANDLPDPEPFGFLGVSGSGAIPLGGFRSKDYRNYHAGYAMDGIGVNFINFQYRLSRNFATGAIGYANSFGFSVDDFLVPYVEFNPNLSFSGESENWSLQTIAGLFCVTVPHELIDFDARFSVGLARVTRPNLTMTIIDRDPNGFDNILWVQEPATTNSAVFGAGINIRFHVHELIDFLVVADYQRTKVDYEVENYYNGVAVFTDEYEQHVEWLNTGLGLALVLR